MKTFLMIVVLGVAWILYQPPPKAQWTGALAPNEPQQTAETRPRTWEHKNYFITAKAKYHIQAVVLSKHHYWSGTDTDNLAPYDLALGWGPMSDAQVIRQLKITQDGRWYEYHWKDAPLIDGAIIMAHSANNHIIAADAQVLSAIKKIATYDLIELDGYLINAQNKKDGSEWKSSMTRLDTDGGACEVFWVTDVKILNH